MLRHVLGLDIRVLKVTYLYMLNSRLVCLFHKDFFGAAGYFDGDDASRFPWMLRCVFVDPMHGF